SGADATAELTESLGELTDGTPFLLCELWRALNEADTVEVSDAGVRLKRPPAELSSPESVRDVVSYRLSRLPPEPTSMLRVPALPGGEFELSALGHEAAALAAADVAIECGMIEPVPQHAAAYRFTHELIRRALYDRLSGLHRA